MTDQGQHVVDAATRLKAALEQTANALTAADLEGLLKSEAGLELALRNITMPRTLAPQDRAVIRAELEGTRNALIRCRRLGDVLLDVVRLSLEAQGRTPGYGRRDTAADSYGARSVNTTV